MKCVARVRDSLVLARFGGGEGMSLQMERRELQKGEEGELTKARQEGEEGELTKVARAPCLESSFERRTSSIELSRLPPSPIEAKHILPTQGSWMAEVTLASRAVWVTC